MTERSVAIGFISYTSAPILSVWESITNEINNIVQKTGWDVKIITRSDSGILTKERNAIVSDFMSLGCTDLIMCDDDNHPDPGGFLKILLQDGDVIGIPCRQKRHEEKWPVRFDVNQPIQRNDWTGLLEVESVGTGIMRIKRNVIEKMIAVTPEEWYIDKTTISGKAHDLFKFEIRNNAYLGEDVSFCLRWRDLGGKVWINPDIVTHHYGRAAYSGCVSNWLMNGLPNLKYSDNAELFKGERTLVNDFSIDRLPEKSVAMIIASRNNIESLKKIITENLKGTTLSSTKIVVGLDDDDPTVDEAVEFLRAFPEKAGIIPIVGPREDSIGAVYNRCAAAVSADVYINFADDAIITSQNWDARIVKELEKFPDGIGVIGLGEMPIRSMLPGSSAVTRGMIDKMGYFMQPFTPYWWMDTWLYEISVMIGRLLPMDLTVEHGEWMKTRGMREVTYWAKFFDDTRKERRAMAERIIRGPDFKTVPTVKQILLDKLDQECERFLFSNSGLRDPERAKEITDHFAHDAPEDERYKRIKARSLELLSKIAA